MSVELETMSRGELEKLAVDVDKALKTLDSRRKTEARRELEQKAKELGFSLEELANGATKGKTKSAPKYRHPENPNVTWTGRGRQPAWIKDGLASGKSLEDFAI